ncbi:MAG: GAF domain-containing sensor histidine kinase, partial [Candidatus Dormibacteraceae bacterium]
MYRRNRELAEAGRVLSLLHTINALAESDTSLQEVAVGISEALTLATGSAFVGLMTPAPRSKNEVVLSGWSGADWLGRQPDPTLNLGRPLHALLAHPWFAQIERTKLISLEGVPDVHLADFLGCHPSDIRRISKYVPLKSLYVVKLVVRRRLMGLLIIGYAAPVTKLNPTEAELLEQLSGCIGVALDNRLLLEENRRVRHRLKESNAKLVALDEAKDDFISMASHQLRTPLTSVKGYTSMVLEGDVGKITAAQRKLLNQSFFSAQRMVYLIADLLNVSRLKTGKFVVEATPVNLAEVIQEEVDQLKETAASRSLRLSYTRPKKFPEVMLDETKTRQVIMNFIDNAIYYTPAKGHIDIRLLETAATIEFRVQDDGMGVPKSEQPHLFTKFY